MGSRSLLGVGLAAATAALAVSAPAGAATGSPIVRVLHLVDRSRSIRLPDGRVVPRPVTTYVHIPATGPGPWPLVVFGHGYAATPGIYAHLLQAWTLAGYVVAAPLFPLGNAHAPGGPDEADIVNQPGDMSFVISQLLAASRAPRGPLHGLVEASRIAVAGQSDGGETAFATAYEAPYRDSRVRAAVILSGVALPGAPSGLPRPSVPLLAVQGTADTTNPPSYTYAFYAAARRPKFLLALPGAGHLPPYTRDTRQRRVVEAVTTAFLDCYLKHGPLEEIERAADVPGVASLRKSP